MKKSHIWWSLSSLAVLAYAYALFYALSHIDLAMVTMPVAVLFGLCAVAFGLSGIGTGLKDIARSLRKP